MSLLAGLCCAVTMTGALPSWAAPAATVTVGGWTGSRTPVALLAGSYTLGRSTSGRLGRFTVSGAAPPPGRYVIAVAAGMKRTRVGVLQVRPVVLAAAGDVTFGEGIAAYGAEYPWRSVGPVFRAADIATVNLETVVSGRGSPIPGKPFTFRGPPGHLAAARRLAGLDVVSVANNHSGDFGREAFLDTLAAARRAGIAPVGGGSSLAAARRPVVLTRGGLRIAFLAYGDIEPPSFFAGPSSPGTAPASAGAVRADAAKASRTADVVVVWFHWGIERMFTPNGRQQELAAAAFAGGADLVLGAHPHVLQPIERRGRRLVAWSLGNFVFLPNSPGTERSGILMVQLDARGVRSFRLRPALVGPQPRLAGP